MRQIAEVPVFIHVDTQALPIRPALAAAIEAAWVRLAGAGTWWNPAERVAIAAQVRQAEDCRRCAAQKRAPSPDAVTGTHDGTGHLPVHLVAVIHRIATDAGRITQSWVRSMVDGPLGEEPFVEIVPLVAIVTAVVKVADATGVPIEDWKAERTKLLRAELAIDRFRR